ncbi:hypothetical protein AB833_25875 [Chromatiales bacterium (ex Bugula neritina AB1)]|nr:hypothetical protein AB833_25875 [Chromatiales bacterium (ex Bugula neritina AB1)]
MKVAKTSVVKWSALIALIVLSAVTGLLLTQVEQFYVEKEQLLKDPSFVAGGWSERGSNSVIFEGDSAVIENAHDGVSHSLYQTVPIGEVGYYRLSFEAATKDVSRGPKDWHRANITAIHRDIDSNKINHQAVLQLDGNTPLRPYSEILLLGAATKSLDVSFRLLNASGRFIIRDPVLSKLAIFPAYTYTKYALMAVWVLTAVCLMVLAVRTLSRGLLISVSALVGVTMVGVLLPEFMMDRLSSEMAALLPDNVRDMSRAFFAKIYGVGELAGGASDMSKLGHIVAFLLIGFVLGVYYRAVGIIYGLVVIVAFALMTESLQLFINGRGSSWIDAAIDSVAGAAGLLPGVLLAMMFGRDDPESETNSTLSLDR